MLARWRIFFILPLCLAFILAGNWAFAMEQPADDRSTHAAAAFCISSVSYVMMKRKRYTKWESLLGAFTLTTTIGLAKEIGDKEFSGGDVVADLAGAGASFLLFLTFDW